MVGHLGDRWSFSLTQAQSCTTAPNDKLTLCFHIPCGPALLSSAVPSSKRAAGTHTSWDTTPRGAVTPASALSPLLARPRCTEAQQQLS